MAKKMAYTDPQSGAAFAESVWLPLGVFIDFSGPHGNVVFMGYATQTIAAKKLLAVLDLPGGENKAVIGTKSYPLTADQCRTLAMAAASGTMLDALSTICYQIAADTPDTPAPTEQEPNRKVSFFHDATDVDLLAAP
jgi:hypothetical protein